MSTNSPVLQLAPDQLAEETYRSESLYTKGLRRLLRDRLTMTALIIIALLLIISFSSPLINQYILQIDPNKTNAMNTLKGYGTPGHLLGTDELGRARVAVDRVLRRDRIPDHRHDCRVDYRLFWRCRRRYRQLGDYHARLDPIIVSADYDRGVIATYGGGADSRDRPH